VYLIMIACVLTIDRLVRSLVAAFLIVKGELRLAPRNLPTAIVGLNRVWRSMAIEAIKLDPAWNQGNYVEQHRDLRVLNANEGRSLETPSQGSTGTVLASAFSTPSFAEKVRSSSNTVHIN
jgi:hypothetical protein